MNVNDPKTKVTGLANNASYTFTWTITNSCGTSSSNVIITTTNTAGPKQAIAGSSQCLSSGTISLNLGGNAPSGSETGTWAFVSGPNTPTITSSSSASTTVTGAVDGIYKFEWSLVTAGCIATRDTVMITASAPATVATITTNPVNLCGATSFNLAGNTPSIGIGTWTQVGGPGGAVIVTPNSPTSNVTGIAPGSYIFRWTIANGSCPSNYADVQYNISTPPTTPTVGVDQSLCGLTSTTLSGNTITTGTGLWKVDSGPNTPNFSSLSNPTATLSGLAMGVYKLRWTSNNGVNCPTSVSPVLTLTVTQNATASVTSSGLCNATVAQLTGNAGSTGTWTLVSGSSVPTITANASNTAIASNLINGTYTFRYTIPATGACIATSATVAINITASPSPAQAGPDQLLCGAASTPLAATAPGIGTGTWSILSQPGGGSPAFSNVNTANATFSGMVPGVYLLQWNVANGNCGTNQDIVRITTYAVPTTAVAGANQITACTGNLFLNGNTPTVGIGTWSQVSGLSATIDAPNSPSTAILGTSPGSYTFLWTIANGVCTASTSAISITVTSTPPNPASAGPDQQLCNVGVSAIATLAGSSPTGVETGIWTVTSKPGGSSPTFVDATKYNTQVNNLTAGTYTFTWTVSNGSCQSSSSVNITVTDKPTTANAGLDQSFCLYSPVSLNATAVSVGVGTWSVTSQPVSTPAPVFSDENSNTTAVNGLLSGDYVFTWITTNGGACATSMSSVTIHIVPPPTPAQAGSFQTVCAGINPVLAANNPSVGTGTWSVITSAGGSPTFTNVNAYNSVVTGLVAGVYTFSWTITSGGCTSNDAVQITVQPALGNNAIVSSPQTICSGATPIAMTGTTPTGGDGTSYNYQWQQSTTDAVSGFANISGATASTYAPGSLTNTTWYRRTVTSGACSVANFSNTVQVTVQPPIANNVVTLPITATFCQSGDPAPITGSIPTGGDGATYTYQWEQSITSAVAGFTAITGATASDYDPATLNQSTWFRRNVFSGTCNNTSTAAKITINPYATLTSTPSPAAICSGASFSYSPTASIGGTTYTWSRSAIATINGNLGGSGSGNINETLTNSAGVPVDVAYLYSLTVTGCTNPIAYSVTVRVNPTPAVTSPSNQVVCNGSLTGAVIFAGSPVASTVFNWTNSLPSIGLAASGTGNIAAFTAVNSSNVSVTASITVTPVSNTCNGTAQTFTIVVNPTPAITAINVNSCTGVAFSVTPTNGTNGIVPAGTTYAWSAPAGSGFSGGASGNTSSNINGLLTNTNSIAQTATYTITPNTSACGNGPDFTVTVTVNPVAVITDMTATTCAGVAFAVSPANGNNGTVPAGTKYAWTIPTGTGFTGGAANSNQATVLGTLTNRSGTVTAVAAVYTVTPTSGSCVGAAFTTTITINPKALTTPMTATTCSGVLITVTPTNGVNGTLPAGTTYSWSAPTATAITGAVTGTNAVDITATLINTSNIARTITYTLTPTSGSCTGNVFTVTITVNPVVSINTFTRTICSLVPFTATPVNLTNGIVPAGTLYSWSSPTLTGSLTGGAAATIVTSISGTLNNPGTSAETATYIVTPSTIACGGGAAFSIIVSVNPVAAINQMSTVVCGGVAFSLTPTDGIDGVIPAGTKYSWSVPSGAGVAGGVSSSNQLNISGTLTNSINTAVTATYAVTPTAGSCTGSNFTVTISINPKAVINALTAVICNGASFNTLPTNLTNGIVPSGTTYAWLAPSGSGFTGGLSGTGSSISGTLANATSSAKTANYIITPTTGSCTGNIFTITVTVSPIAAVNDLTATTCSGVTFVVSPVDVTNGTIPSGTVYSWAAPTGAGFTGGVTGTSQSTITGTLVNITTSPVQVNYTVTPSSAGCTGAAFTVTVTINPSAAINTMSVISCGGVSFSVTPTDITNGRVPPATTYSWAVPTGAGFTGGVSKTGVTNIFGLLSNSTNASVTATYTVTPVTNGCTGSTFTFTVSLNPAAIINAMTSVICNGATFSVTPTNLTNGIVPAGTTYSWPAPSVTGSITGGLSGSLASTISGTLNTQSNAQETATYVVSPLTTNCGVGATFTVTVTLNPTATITDMTAVTCGGIGFTVTPTQSTDGIVPSGTKYSWSVPTGTGFTGGASTTNANNINCTLTNNTSNIVIAKYTVTPLTGSCTGAVFSVTVTLNPKAFVSALTATSCSGTGFTITPVDVMNGIIPTGTTYSWVLPTGTGITGGTTATGSATINGTLNNTTNIARTATYSVTPVSGTCSGSAFTLTVTISPIATINALTNISCSGTLFTVSPTNVTNGIVPSGTLYSWSLPTGTGFTGGATATNAASITGTLTNTTSSAVTATYIVTPLSGSCNGAPFTVTVTVSPKASVNNLTLVNCSGIPFILSPTDNTNGIIPSGTLYSWSVPTVTGGITGGLSATNASSISGTLTNPTNIAQTATYIVTPLSGNCSGASFSVTVNVNPIAVISAMTAATCSGVSFSLTPVNGTNGIVPASTTFSWSVPTVTGGMTGGLSSTNASFINGLLTNPTNSIQTATYTITPLTSNCGTGATFMLTITIYPVASINAMTVVSCAGVSFTVTPTNSTNGIVPNGTTYTWLAPTGSGFTGGLSGAIQQSTINGLLTNTTANPVTATYLVTPSGVCNGAAFSVTITLNPRAFLNTLTATSCSGTGFAITPTDIVNGIIPSGTTFTWSVPTGTAISGGLSQSIGINSISGLLTNTSNIARTATYLVTPSSGGCSGDVFTVTVTVNPLASIVNLTATTCNGVQFSLTPVNTTNGIVPSGTLYSWSVPIATGGVTGGQSATNAASISGVFNNPTNAIQTATYVVTPVAGNCTGAAFTVTVTISPSATINSFTAISCSGSAFALTLADGVNGIIPAGTKLAWSAPSGVGFTGGAIASNQTNINGNLTNTTPAAITATYSVIPLSGACTGAVFTVTVTINPAPVLSSSLTPAAVCNNNSFSYIATSATVGTNFTWSRTIVTGIGATGAATGTGNIGTQLLTNSTTAPLSLQYVYTLDANGCTNPASNTVTVVVNPTPVLTSSLNPGTILNATTFSYTATSATTGTTYTWSRPAIAAINSNVAGSGSGASISEPLTTASASLTNVSYVISLTANGCTNAQTVTIQVSPIPALSSSLAPGGLCSGNVFIYTATSATPGTTFTWTRAAIPSINGNTSGSGLTGTINETLTNSSNIPVPVIYAVVLSANGFTNTQNVTYIVYPTPSVTQPAQQIVCNGTAIAPVTFTGSVLNAVYNWTNNTTSIGLSASGSGNINAFTAVNGTAAPITALITVTAISNTCSGAAVSFTIIVNPTPTLSSSLNPTGICNGTGFSYTATSATNRCFICLVKNHGNWYCCYRCCYRNR